MAVDLNYPTSSYDRRDFARVDRRSRLGRGVLQQKAADLGESPGASSRCADTFGAQSRNRGCGWDDRYLWNPESGAPELLGSEGRAGFIATSRGEEGSN